MGRSRLALVLAASLVATTGCDGSHALFLDVRTDLAPGIDFASVRTELYEGDGTGASLRTERADASAEADFLAGVRVAELEALDPGEYTARVALLDAAEAVRVERLLRVTVRGSLAITVVISRRCVGVRCPGPSDAAELSACVDGACVDPSCAPERPEACGDAQCAMDADCAATTACAEPRCTEGLCLLVPHDERCGASARCDVAAGCVPRPGAGGVVVGAARAVGGPGDDLGEAVAVDTADNVYVSGGFSDVVDFGGGPTTSNGSRDVFVASYGVNGEPRWSRGFGSVEDEHASGVAARGGGPVYVVGYFRGPTSLGDAATHVPAGDRDAFLASFDPIDGSHEFSVPFGGPGADEAEAVSSDASHTAYVAGSFETGLDFGAGAYTTLGGEDAFVASFDSSGGFLRAHTFGGTGHDQIEGMGIAPSGRLGLAGRFEAAVVLSTGALAHRGARDAFTVGLEGDLTERLGAAIGGTGDDEAEDAAIDDDGNVVVTGTFEDTLSTGENSMGAEDVFVASFAADGSLRWLRTFGGPDSDGGEAIALDGTGNAYVAGHFHDSVDAGGGALVSAGSDDVFVVSFAPDGAHRWSRRFGGPGTDLGRGLAIDSARRVWVTGGFSGAVDFGTGVVQSAGDLDLFLLRLDPAP